MDQDRNHYLWKPVDDGYTASIMQEFQENVCLRCGSLEKGSEHPLAEAIVSDCGKKNIVPEKVNDFEALFGKGIKGRLSSGRLYYAGNEKLMERHTLPWPVR